MILTAHILVGAAIGAKLGNPFLIVPAAYLSHILLDAFPHWEYSIDGLDERRYTKAFLHKILKVFLDLAVGFSSVYFLARVVDPAILPFMALGGFFGALPDGVTFLEWHTGSKVLHTINQFHRIIQVPNRLRKIKKPSLWIMDPESGGIVFEALAIAAALFIVLNLL